MPSTRSVRSTRTRPRSSTGSPLAEASGDGRTPAVHTTVAAAIEEPSLRRTVPSSIETSLVSVRIWMPRSRSRSAAYVASVGSSSGRILCVASTTTQRISLAIPGGYVARAARAKSSSSPIASIPANPAPTNTNPSAVRRSSTSSASEAVSSCARTRFRSQIASGSVLNPTACSASPGIGRVRDHEPAPMTATSNGSSRRRPSDRWIRAVRLSASIRSTSPRMSRVRRSALRSGTTTARGSISPLATSSRNG